MGALWNWKWVRSLIKHGDHNNKLLMKVLSNTLKISGLLFFATVKLHAQDNFKLNENFSDPHKQYEKIGRGECSIAHDVLTTKDAYLNFGEYNWKNYEIKFKARVPDTAEQVQICAGFRT